jgi:membrane associated rhomboid family serine protease
VRLRGCPLTVALMGGCLLASVPLLLFPSLRDTLGAGASRPVVGLLTSPFVHGFSTASLIPHLAGNLLLLWYAGSRVERRLGTARFALLTLAAVGVYAVVVVASSADVNGASVFIWAYAPPLAVLYRFRPRTERGFGGADDAATPVVLAVMWIVVPLLMTTVPYAFGWSGGPIVAFFVSNTFHISATVVGIGGAWVWRDRLSTNTVGKRGPRGPSGGPVHSASGNHHP